MNRPHHRQVTVFESIDPAQLGLVVGLVLALGAAVAAALWLARLRWSWAALGVVPAAIALPLSVLVAGTTAAASALACGLGFAWHLGELGKGGTEAQATRARVGPARLLRYAIATRRWRGQPVRGTRVAIGRTSDHRVATLPFGSTQGVRGFVPGGPGSGKTVSLTALALAYVEQGLPVVCIDPKGDPALRASLESATRERGAPFIAWTPAGPTVYNPLGRGEPSEIADKALAGEHWSEPHYLRQAQRYLGQALRVMRATGHWPPSLHSLAELIEPDRLGALAAEAPDRVAEMALDYLECLSPRTRAELGGVRDRLSVLAESGVGRWLDPAGAGDDADAPIDLHASLRSNATVYFALDADRYPLASQMLGAAIVTDLIAVSGEMQGAPTRGLVVIDEFAALESDAVGRLLSRSRSAGISVVLATQALADLELAGREGGGEAYRRQILSHVDFILAHRQSEPEAAEILAKMACTRPEWSTTRRVSGFAALGLKQVSDEGTRTRQRDFVRHPDEFKRLGVGEAISIEPARRGDAETVSVWRRAA